MKAAFFAKNMTTARIHVVIPSWNLKDDLIECIDSLSHSSFPEPVRVVVVDDGSTDGTSDFLADRLGDAIHLIRLDTNQGYAKAANRGIAWAIQNGAEYVLLLNNDTVVEASMLAQLLAALDMNPSAGLAGPAIYLHSQPDRLWRIGDRQFWKLPLTRQVGIPKTSVTPFPVDYITGCAMFISRRVFEAVGLLDTGFQMYFEDADFCCRATTAGFTILAVPQAKMLHKVGRSTLLNESRRIYLQNRGRTIFMTRYHRGWMGFIAAAYVALHAFFEGAGYLWRCHPTLLRWQLKGIHDGLAFQRGRK